MSHVRLTVPEVEPLVRALYHKHPMGCCLHIVLDDENVSDSNVRFCAQYAVEQDHPSCYTLALILLSMSRTQRLKLGSLPGLRA